MEWGIVKKIHTQNAKDLGNKVQNHAQPRSAVPQALRSAGTVILEDKARAAEMRAEAVREEAQRRLGRPVLGHRGTLLPLEGKSKQSRPATVTVGGKAWRRDCGKFPYYSDRGTVRALREVRVNPHFTTMRRMDIEEPVRTPQGQRLAMSKEVWHVEGYKELATKTHMHIGMHARSLGFGNFPLSADDRAPIGSLHSEQWSTIDKPGRTEFDTFREAPLTGPPKLSDPIAHNSSAMVSYHDL
jgi:hypothetical protein